MRVRSIHSIMVLLWFLFRRSLIITFFEYVLFYFGVKFPLLWVSVVLIMSLVSSFSAHFKASCICINIALCRCVENVAKETKSPFHNVSFLPQILTSDSQICVLYPFPFPACLAASTFFCEMSSDAFFPRSSPKSHPSLTKSHLPHSEQDLFLRKPLVSNFFAQLQTNTSPIPQSFLASQSLLHGLRQPHMIVNRVLSP